MPIRKRSWFQGPRSRLKTLVLLILSPVALLYLWLLFLPWPVALIHWNPKRTSFMEYRIREAEKRGDDLEIQQVWAPLDSISPRLQRAVLVSEDDRFYQHGGIDWRALAEEVHYRGDTIFSWWSTDDLGALWAAGQYFRAHRSDIKGRSTVTQQLAKNLYFTPARSLFRKLGEAVVAKRLEALLTKDRILELYLNVAEWGPGVFGAQAAAHTYFHRPAADLTLDQAAALAATLPHPLTSNPSYRPAATNWRKSLILSRLRGPALPTPPPVDVPILPDTSLTGS